MLKKVIPLDDGLSVTIYKRKSSRNLRLSVAATGEVRVSIPTWASFKAGEAFARARQDWIRAQVTTPSLLQDGQAIGKAHHLSLFMNPRAKKISSRVVNGTVIVSFPAGVSAGDTEVQQTAREACVRALRSQAEQLLPKRLATLAEQYDFTYGSVSVKRLKGRWGSCDHHKNIVLNLYLMQLPWELIDYVLLHELTHTRIMKHGPVFWDAMAAIAPNTVRVRKAIKQHSPVLLGGTL